MMRIRTLNSVLFYKMRMSIKKSILSGRYLASISNADPNSWSRGLVEFEKAQIALDKMYPNAYKIIVYKNTANPIVFEEVFHGTPNNGIVIPILWLAAQGSNDFFGLRTQMKPRANGLFSFFL